MIWYLLCVNIYFYLISCFFYYHKSKSEWERCKFAKYYFYIFMYKLQLIGIHWVSLLCIKYALKRNQNLICSQHKLFLLITQCIHFMYFLLLLLFIRLQVRQECCSFLSCNGAYFLSCKYMLHLLELIISLTLLVANNSCA